MARKHPRAEMTFTSQAEMDEFDKLCANLGYSRSDALRQAVNIAHQLDWPVPLWRKPVKKQRKKKPQP